LLGHLGSFWAAHGVEALGTALGLVYLFFSIRQSPWLWFFGLGTSGLYIWVFARAGLYADMGLQFYYVAMSLYGLWHWLFAGSRLRASPLPVSRSGRGEWLALGLVFVLAWASLLALLLLLPGWLGLPEASFPAADAATTAASFVATWQLARKRLENWLLWIAIDLASAYMYWLKDLSFTTFLFLCYAALALVGYQAWKKSLLS